MADSIKIGNLDISAFKVGSDDCKIYLGDTLLYPHSAPSYTLLQGLERKVGNLGYVDLGLKVGTDFVINITLNYKTAAGGYFIGCDKTFRWFLATQSGQLRSFFDYNGQRIYRAAGDYYPLNTDYNVTLKNYSMKSSLKTLKTTGTTQTSYLSENNLKLFSTNYQSNGDLGVVYNVKVYTDDGDTLVGDFIPVRRNSDNVVTMYNTVTNTFCDVYGDLYGIDIS